MIMFLFLFVILFSIGCLGIPTIIYFFILDMAKDTDLYVEAIIILFFSAVELIRFIQYALFADTIRIDFKAILLRLKSIFTRNTDEYDEYIKSNSNEWKQNSLKGLSKEQGKAKHKKVILIESIILLVFLIYSIIVPPHSILLNLIYSSIISRILFGIWIPLFIINIVNEIREHDLYWGDHFLALLAGVVFSASLMLAAEFTEKDFPQAKNFITSQFIYDDDSYDEIRKEKNITDEYEFLKGVYNNALDELYKDYDINNKEDFEKIKKEINSKISINKYGFKVPDIRWYDDDNMILYIIDKKTNKYNYYKLNIRTNSFEKSNEEEWKESKKK